MIVEIVKFIAALIIVIPTYIVLIGTIMVLVGWPVIFVMPKGFLREEYQSFKMVFARRKEKDEKRWQL